MSDPMFWLLFAVVLVFFAGIFWLTGRLLDRASKRRRQQ